MNYNKKLRIAYIIPALDEKGPIIFTKNLIASLSDIADIEVFYFKESHGVDFGVKCHKISFWRKNSFDEFDVVHTTMAVPDIYASLRIKNNKWISSMHNFMANDFNLSKGGVKGMLICFLWKKALNRCSNIIISSNCMKEYYLSFLGPKNYSVIAYGISEPMYSDIKKEDFDVINGLKKRGLKIIGLVGVFVERKGYFQLINVIKEKKDFALVIIGDGPDRDKFLEKCKEQGMIDRVYCPGFRSNSFNYYQYFDIYANVSYSEGFGLAVIEAMSKSLPAVLPKLNIYQEYFDDNIVCFFNNNDEKSLIDAIEKADKYSDEYRIASKEAYEKYFKSTVMGALHMKYYQEIVNK